MRSTLEIANRGRRRIRQVVRTLLLVGAVGSLQLALTAVAAGQSPQPPPAKTGHAGAISQTPQFFDEPKFTVSGVTDATNPGGHGSNAIVRTTEALAKDTASLAPGNEARVPTSAAEEESLRQLADREPANVDTNRRLGKLLVEDGKAAKALPYLERASTAAPDDYASAYELALAYVGTGQYERARDNTRTLLAAQDKAKQPDAQRQAELHHLLGEVEEKLHDPLQAVREYQRAAELNPSEENLFDWGAELLVHRAYEPAINVFAKGNQLFTRSVRMLTGLGVANYARGSYDAAVQYLCQASDLDPKDSNPYLLMGKMQGGETIRTGCQEQRLARFVALRPESALANYYYALSLRSQREAADPGNAVRVRELLEKAVRLDPKLAAAYLQLGILSSEQGDLANEVRYYERAAQASPELEQAHYRLAQAYRRMGETSKAEAELKLYDQLSKRSGEQAERERRDIQQFVYTLQVQSPDARPQ